MQKQSIIVILTAEVQLRLGDFHAALECYTKAADLAPGISGIQDFASGYGLHSFEKRKIPACSASEVIADHTCFSAKGKCSLQAAKVRPGGE